jgi:hypothetical protein
MPSQEKLCSSSTCSTDCLRATVNVNHCSFQYHCQVRGIVAFWPTSEAHQAVILEKSKRRYLTQPRRRVIFLLGQEGTVSSRSRSGCCNTVSTQLGSPGFFLKLPNVLKLDV